MQCGCRGSSTKFRATQLLLIYKGLPGQGTFESTLIPRRMCEGENILKRY